MPRLLLLCAAFSGACTLTRLAQPEAGTCDATIEINRWPKYEGNDGVKPDIVDRGWNVGDVLPDFRLVDQFGEPVCLDQMIGHWVVVDWSSQWCIPCQQIAQTVRCQAEAYGDDLVYMTLLDEDHANQPATTETAVQWADLYELSLGTQTPVIADGTEVVVSNFPGTGNDVPILILLNPDLEVVTWGIGLPGDRAIRRVLDRELGDVAGACTHQ